MSKLIPLLLTPVLLLAACKPADDPEKAYPAGRFQVVQAPRHEGEPWILRVDTTSGKTWVLDTLSTNGLNWLAIPGSDERESKR